VSAFSRFALTLFILTSGGLCDTLTVFGDQVRHEVPELRLGQPEW
jgi:hypothetical protein